MRMKKTIQNSKIALRLDAFYFLVSFYWTGQTKTKLYEDH